MSEHIAMILALDLGSRTGFAWQTADDKQSGTLVLVPEKTMKPLRASGEDRRLDPRVIALWEWINATLDHRGQTLVVFEDVQFSTYTAQTQLWASLRAAVWLSDASLIDCVPVGTLKKFATDKGNATKEQMLAAFKRKGGDWRKTVHQDDNEVDAIFALQWALSKYGTPR